MASKSSLDKISISTEDASCERKGGGEVHRLLEVLVEFTTKLQSHVRSQKPVADLHRMFVGNYLHVKLINFTLVGYP